MFHPSGAFNIRGGFLLLTCRSSGAVDTLTSRMTARVAWRFVARCSEVQEQVATSTTRYNFCGEASNVAISPCLQAWVHRATSGHATRAAIRDVVHPARKIINNQHNNNISSLRQKRRSPKRSRPPPRDRGRLGFSTIRAGHRMFPGVCLVSFFTFVKLSALLVNLNYVNIFKTSPAYLRRIVRKWENLRGAAISAGLQLG